MFISEAATAIVTKPRRLSPGDCVAVVSPSWGGPHCFPHVFDAGLAELSRLGLAVREFPTARMPPAELAANPRLRAADINAAFEDPAIAGVIASIGGNDSGRILPFLDANTLRFNPKVLLGFSDTSTLLVYAHLLGMVTFYGPSVMAGFAQLHNFPAAKEHLRAVLFEASPSVLYNPSPLWSNNYAPWETTDGTQVAALVPHDGWHWINGSSPCTGRLFGGCIEVLEFLKGSRYWPDSSFWNGRILFLETSEDVPTVQQVHDWLFNYGVQGAFEGISALLFGRARSYSDQQKSELDDVILRTVVGQFGATNLPIVTNMDFGHTDPQWVLPLGGLCEVDPRNRSFRLLEPAVL